MRLLFWSLLILAGVVLFPIFLLFALFLKIKRSVEMYKVTRLLRKIKEGSAENFIDYGKGAK